MSSNELTQKMVLEHFPFTVKTAKVTIGNEAPEYEGNIDLLLTNPAGGSLEIHSDDRWQLVAPSGSYNPYRWFYDAENSAFQKYNSDLQAVCEQLVGAQLTDMCGYENLHANSFVFDNGFVLRLIKTSDSWYEYIGSYVALGGSLDSPWTGYLGSLEMRDKYLPLELFTSVRNPFDVLISVSHPVLRSAVGAVVVDVECPAQEQPICAAYSLRIVLSDGSVIFVRNSWAVSSSRGVWVSQSEKDRRVEQEFMRMFRELVGQRFLGFAGPADLVQPSLLFDGGTRVDQLAEREVVGVVRPRGWWSVNNRYGVFKR